MRFELQPAFALLVFALTCSAPATTPPVKDRTAADRPSADAQRPKQAAAPIASADPASESPAARPTASPAPTPTPPASAKPPALTPTRSVRPEAASGLRAFAAQRKDAAYLFTGPLNGNGGRDVLVFVPSAPDPTAPFRLVVHFHGTYSEHIEPRAPGTPKKRWVGWKRLEQTLDAAAQLQTDRSYNVVLVYPISAGKRLEPDHEGWSNVNYDRMWMKTDDFDRLLDEVEALLRSEFGVPREAIAKRVVAEGHSAGGIALRNVAESGTQRVGTYLFLDASFQGWADGCYYANAENEGGAMVTLVITEDGMADPVGRWKPWCLDLEHDAARWKTHEEHCAMRPSQSVPGTELTCDALAERAELWETSQAWCEGAKNDMRGWSGVTVHRTKVRHGAQPRHFAGGLELPPALQP